MVGPVTPSSGTGGTGGTGGTDPVTSSSDGAYINPFVDNSGLSDQSRAILDAFLDDLRSGLVIDKPRIPINDLFSSVYESLQQLIEVLREADIEGNKGLYITSVSQSNNAIQNYFNYINQLANSQQQMDSLRLKAQDVDAKANEVEDARDAYNDAVTDYINDPDPANGKLAALQAAEANLATKIDEYNAAVTVYNNEIASINQDRTDAGFDTLDITNGINPLPLIPDEEKLSFTVPPSVLIPPVTTEAPDPLPFEFIDLISTESIFNRLPDAPNKDDYETAYNALVSQRNSLNDLIIQINDAAAQPGFDINTDYPPLAAEYNAAVADYNAALAAAQAERDTYLTYVPDNPRFYWDLPEQQTIPISVTTFTPLDEIIPKSNIYSSYGDDKIVSSYDTAYRDFTGIQSQLNDQIAFMNADYAEHPENYEANAIVYNDLVSEYNDALATLRTERDNYNDAVPDNGEISWTIPDQSTISTTVPSIPLSTITAEPVRPIWPAAFQEYVDEYNNALSAYETALDDLNTTIDTINTAYQSPTYDINTDYATLATTYNDALDAYNQAVSDFTTARDNWNTFVNSRTQTVVKDNGQEVTLSGLWGPPVSFDVQEESPLPIPPPSYLVPNSDPPPDNFTIYVEPPPYSDLTFLAIYDTSPITTDPDFTTTKGDQLFNPNTGLSDQSAVNTSADFVASNQALLDILFQFEDVEKLSLIFLARGKPTSALYEPISSGVGTGPTSATGGTLSALVLGLGNPKLLSVLARLDVDQTVENLFNDLAIETPQNLGAALQNVTLQGGANAALSSTRFALLQSLNLLKTQSPDSFPVNLASFVALASALKAIGANGGFADLTSKILGGLEAVKALPNDNRDELFTTIGNLSSFFLTFSAISDLGNVSGTPPEFALGNLALNLSFGSAGSQLDIREALKSVTDTLQGTDLDRFQQNLTDAFKDVLLSNGITGDSSKALALQFTSRLFAADNPKDFVRELLPNVNNPEAIANQIRNVAALATFAPQLQNLDGKLSIKEGSPTYEALQNRLKNAGLDANLANAFTKVGEGSFLNQAAKLQGEVGPEALKIALRTIRDVAIAQSLNTQLGGSVGTSDAQELIRNALTNINSLENQQDRVIKEFNDQENNKAIDRLSDFAKELYKKAEKPEVFLQQLTDPAKTTLRYGSLYWEGTIPQTTNMRTDTGPRDIDIAI